MLEGVEREEKVGWCRAWNASDSFGTSVAIKVCGRGSSFVFPYKMELRREGSHVKVYDEVRQCDRDGNGLKEEVDWAMKASRGSVGQIFFTGNVLGMEGDSLCFRDVVNLLEDEVG